MTSVSFTLSNAWVRSMKHMKAGLLNSMAFLAICLSMTHIPVLVTSSANIFVNFEGLGIYFLPFVKIGIVIMSFYSEGILCRNVLLYIL